MNLETLITSLASRQHGLVTRRQLLDAGIGTSHIGRRVRVGWLHVVHRGVYRVGPVASPLMKEMAASLACAGAGIISHGSAAALWRELPRRRRPAVVHVVAPKGDRPGIRVHRIATLAEDEVATFQGIPVTTPARTILDLAGTTKPRQLEQALADLLARALTSPEEVRTVLARHRSAPGQAALRAILDRGDPDFIESKAEELVRGLVLKADLGRPKVNVIVAGHRVDFLFPAERVVLEVDGYAFHSSRRAFENDRRRDLDLAAAGYTVVRLTWTQITTRPEAAIAKLAQALAAANLRRTAHPL